MLISYEKFYNKLISEAPEAIPPKLLICGHGSVDDPDGARIYDEVIDYLDTQAHDIRQLICVIDAWR